MAKELPYQYSLRYAVKYGERMNGAKVIRKTANVQELSNKQSMKTTRITV